MQHAKVAEQLKRYNSRVLSIVYQLSALLSMALAIRQLTRLPLTSMSVTEKIAQT